MSIAIIQIYIFYIYIYTYTHTHIFFHNKCFHRNPAISLTRSYVSLLRMSHSFSKDRSISTNYILRFPLTKNFTPSLVSPNKLVHRGTFAKGSAAIGSHEMSNMCALDTAQKRRLKKGGRVHL